MYGIRFVNPKTPIDFTNVNSVAPNQEFSLLSSIYDNSDDVTVDGPIRYSTRAAKFFNVNSLTLLFEKSNSNDSSLIEINYLGFEGEFSQVTSVAIVLLFTFYILFLILRLEWALLKRNMR